MSAIVRFSVIAPLLCLTIGCGGTPNSTDESTADVEGTETPQPSLSPSPAAVMRETVQIPEIRIVGDNLSSKDRSDLEQKMIPEWRAQQQALLDRFNNLEARLDSLSSTEQEQIAALVEANKRLNAYMETLAERLNAGESLQEAVPQATEELGKPANGTSEQGGSGDGSEGGSGGTDGAEHGTTSGDEALDNDDDSRNKLLGMAATGACIAYPAYCPAIMAAAQVLGVDLGLGSVEERTKDMETLVKISSGAPVSDEELARLRQRAAENPILIGPVLEATETAKNDGDNPNREQLEKSFSDEGNEELKRSVPSGGDVGRAIVEKLSSDSPPDITEVVKEVLPNGFASPQQKKDVIAAVQLYGIEHSDKKSKVEEYVAELTKTDVRE